MFSDLSDKPRRVKKNTDGVVRLMVKTNRLRQ